MLEFLISAKSTFTRNLPSSVSKSILIWGKPTTYHQQSTKQHNLFGIMSKILWISHTSLSISETFIANTLHMLKRNHEGLLCREAPLIYVPSRTPASSLSGHASIRESTIEEIWRHAIKTRPFDNRKVEQLKRKMMNLDIQRKTSLFQERAKPLCPKCH